MFGCMNSQGNTITGLQHATAALEVLVNVNSISAFKSPVKDSEQGTKLTI